MARKARANGSETPPVRDEMESCSCGSSDKCDAIPWRVRAPRARTPFILLSLTLAGIPLAVCKEPAVGESGCREALTQNAAFTPAQSYRVWRMSLRAGRFM